MDHLFPAAALSGTALKTQHPETASLTLTKEVSPSVPVALDPRSIYTLSPEAADAVLSLAEVKSAAVEAAEFDVRYGRGPQVTSAVMASTVATTPVVSPETTKTTAAANRNWSEDVRLDHTPFRKVGTDTLVRYDNPRVMAAWSAAFPDIAGRRFRGLQLADTDFKTALSKIAADGGFDGLEKDIYLLCNDVHFRRFSEDHPDTHINWINIDNDDILLFWPRDPGEE